MLVIYTWTPPSDCNCEGRKMNEDKTQPLIPKPRVPRASSKSKTRNSVR